MGIFSVEQFASTLKSGDEFWYLQDDLKGVLQRVAGPYTLLEFRLNRPSLRPTALCKVPMRSEVCELYDSLLVQDPFEAKSGEVEFYVDLLVCKHRIVFTTKEDAELYLEEYRDACRSDPRFLKKVAKYGKMQEEEKEREFWRIMVDDFS